MGAQALLFILLLALLIHQTEAGCVYSWDSADWDFLGPCDSCSGSCDSYNFCSCSDGINACLPNVNVSCIDPALCCPPGLYYSSAESCCTDIPTCSTPCATDEACDVAACVCNATNYQHETLADFHPMETCDVDAMTVTISQCQLSSLGFDPASSHLINSSADCMTLIPAIGSTQRLFTLQAKKTPGWCGNTVTELGSRLYVANSVTINTQNNTNITGGPISFPITCPILSGVNPLAQTLVISGVNGIGLYPLTMAVYKDPGFGNLYESNEIILGPKIYVALYIYYTDADHVLRLQDCVASPTSERNDTEALHLISEGCATDDVTRIIQNGNTTEVRMEISYSKFRDFSTLRLFCDVRLCVKNTDECTMCMSSILSSMEVTELQLDLKIKDPYVTLSSTVPSTGFTPAPTTPWSPECAGGKGSAGSSLTYLVDTTGSMWDDMYELKLVNKWLLDRITARFPCGIRQYTMVEFNDPTVGPVRITSSKDQFAYFFDSLVAYGGGDCPELAIAGLKLALENSPDKSFILVLTDASALDYYRTDLVNEVFSLLSTTQSQVFFVLTGLCGSTRDPDYLIYREIASRSFGHVFQVSAADLNIVFNYLDFTMSQPANNSKQLFSKDYEDENASDSFSISDNFTTLIVTTDGVITSFEIKGPDTSKDDIKKPVNESWGAMYIIKNPAKGNWTIDVEGRYKFSVRVEGSSASNISTTFNCSKCSPDATCEDYFGYLQCSCKDGYIGDGFTCSDVDECAYSWSSKCGYYTCVNTLGSYTCMCPYGYYNDSGEGCVDINECSSPDRNTCTSNATCINYIGSYTCVCAPGYFGDGFSCQLDECAHGACPGVECLKYYGSYSCYDPCVTYTTLDDPWRSTSNGDYYWNCDNDKFGWYRFRGTGGVKMQDSCVSEYRCGTSAPMWLQGSHPLIEDGIVNRTACASWSGSCCMWSTTVQIKLCPGNYYVYKLSGTPACSLSYCTDPSSVTDDCACAENEECSLVDGKYECICKDGFKISDISEIRPNLICGAHEMKASFLKCQLRSQNIDVSKLNIADVGCYTLQDDIINGTYSVTVALKDGQCGVHLTKSSTYATYIKTMDITLGSIDDLYIPTEVVFQMKCSYPLDIQLSLETAINPMVSVISIVTEGTGQFNVSMALFQDASYTLPYQAPEVQLTVRSFLYVGVNLDGPGNFPYVVLMKNCYGTPTRSSNDTVKYYIVKNSCPNRQDSSISVPINGISNEGRFSLQLFKYIYGYSQIYLHCEVNLCDRTAGVCTPSCSDVRSSAVKSDSQSYIISVGPVKLLPEISASSSGTAGAACSVHLLPAIFLLGRILMAYK